MVLGILIIAIIVCVASGVIADSDWNNHTAGMVCVISFVIGIIAFFGRNIYGIYISSTNRRSTSRNCYSC